MNIENITKPTEIRKETNYGWTTHTVKPLNPMQREFLGWAREAFRGETHQRKWLRMLITTGVNRDYLPPDIKHLAKGLREYSLDDVERLWKQHNKNVRWTTAWEWYDKARHDEIARQREFKANLKDEPLPEEPDWIKERNELLDRLDKATPGSPEFDGLLIQINEIHDYHEGEVKPEPYEIHDAVIAEDWDTVIKLAGQMKGD